MRLSATQSGSECPPRLSAEEQFQEQPSGSLSVALTAFAHERNIRAVSFLIVVGILLCSSLGFLAEVSGEALFEKLCQAYKEQQTTDSKAKLLDFCERNTKGPLSSLGYFLLGYQEMEGGNFQLAEEFLSKASVSPTPIQDYVLYQRAAALDGLQRYEDVQKGLAGFSLKFPSSPWIGKAQTLFWKSALSQKDVQAIFSTTGLASSPESLFYQAQAYELLGDSVKARSIYQRLYYHFPLDGNVTFAEQKLQALPKSPGVEVPRQWKITRIEKLFSGKRFREALKDLDNLLQTNAAVSENPQFQLWRGVSQFGTAQYSAAIQTLRGLARASPEVAGQALFTLAECYRKLENYSQFKLAVEEMQSSVATSHWREEALFSIGNYNLVRRNLEESMAFYQMIVEQFPAGARAEDCHWRVSWNEYRRGNYQRSLDLFAEHLIKFSDSDHRAAALYWAAHSQQNLGQLAGAQQAYRAVGQKFPAGYYGQLAQKQIALLTEPTKAGFRTDSRLEKVIREFSMTNQKSEPDLAILRKVSVNDWPRVRALAQVQLFELAALELSRPQVYGSSPAVEFQAAKLFWQDKNFYQSTLRLRRVFPNYLELSFGSLPREIWEMFYPTNYEAIIFREARKYDVDPFLIMAVIRQESAFNPRAISPANAYGLMQILPSTARRLARGMKLPRPSSASLYDPDVNIRLGTRYFSDLLTQFDGQDDKVLASYNAGENRVESWMSEGNYADSAEFVETIPFSETRNYVKIIFRNYFFYNKLYNQTSVTAQ